MHAPAKLRPARRREQLSDEVAGYLRVAIMSGSLRPGTFVRLDETAAQLGVSITPVREALRTLRGEGLVQLEPHRGHVVAPFTRDDIADIFWLQGMIAAELASTAAQRADDTDIDELERLTDALDDAVQGGDVDAIALAEFNFHRTFNRTTNRMKLAWFLLNAARYLPPHIYASDPQWGVEAVANHRQLVTALRQRDVSEVVRLTRSQFDDGARRLTSLLDDLGLWT
ncbi:GntR family transcriptional regulator [Mycolicibacterium frederiksbergense]|uniref:GntR family transcriptional regulator n=1 Tax=Mycolicibacterium frederiksbergense TaxID=117567 RepID=UPI001AE2779D|nr:GntR family transcriptional regulator [Mycolicibacterium frederiksbergense]